jgi:hypothetical protein
MGTLERLTPVDDEPEPFKVGFVPLDRLGLPIPDEVIPTHFEGIRRGTGHHRGTDVD